MNKTKFIIIIVASLFLFFSSNTSNKAAVIFEDNFNDNDTSDWSVPRNNCDSNWQIKNGQYGITINKNCVTETIPSNININPSTNYSFEVDLNMPISTAMDRNFVFKYKDSSNWYGIHVFNNNVYLQKVVNGIEYFLPNWITSYEFASNYIYKFKVEVFETKFNIYVNNKLLQSIQDNIPTFANSKAGLQASGGGNTNSEVWFDNVKVEELPSTSTSLNVPDIKQYTSPWSTKTYDQAKSWFPDDPSIKRWGCALTSADMILNYYGFNIDPGQLNTWLNSQTDGYIPNGQLNWVAVSRYTKEHSTSSIPALEYKRMKATNDNLTNELNSSRPAILQVPGHFIVAKSITNSSFGINDPAYSDRSTLDSYSNSFINIMSYTPSHTDLSYILLTTNPNFNLKIFDTNGNEIKDYIFIDEPLKSDLGDYSNSSNSVKKFEFPKPPAGNYRVEINGNGIYELSSYLYDVNGNPSIKTVKGITGGETDTFTVSIGTKNNLFQSTTIDQIIADWNTLKNQGNLKSNDVYNHIKFLLSIAKDLIKYKNNKLAKTNLNAINLLIKNYTPKFIDKESSSVITSEINILLQQL